MMKWEKNLTQNREAKEMDFTKRRYYCLYTIFFAIASLLIFGCFLIHEKSFIWQSDGWTQHYKALGYFAKWMRTIILSLLSEHRLFIPTYSFSMGYGSDILTTLQYYVIGDPLNLFSVFVPIEYMAYFYSCLIVVRYYLTGITFSMYCFYVGERQDKLKDFCGFSKVAVLSGTFVYTFCGFALYAGIRHPYFLNPMIYFPLILLGVEKILAEDKPILFASSVCLSAISNFYFFYMIVILTVLYVAWRICTVYEKNEIKTSLQKLWTIAKYAFLGTCMGAVMLLPAVWNFLTSSRKDAGYTYDVIYSLGDYLGNFGGFLSLSSGSHDWTVMGYAAIVVIALVLLFVQKDHRNLKIAFIVLTVMTLLPTVGSFMNGFSYVSNRWIWGYSFLLAYIVVTKWESLFFLKKREIWILMAALSAYAICCVVFVKSRDIGAIFGVLMLMLTLSTVILASQKVGNVRIITAVLFLCILGNISGNALFKYSQRNSGYIEEFLDYDDILNQLTYTESVAINHVSKDDEEFFRYSGSSTTVNGSLFSGLSNTQYYWSLENGNISEYRNQMGLSDTLRVFNYKTLDSRTILSALANVKYYVQKSNVPYGYVKIADIGDYSDVQDYLNKNGLSRYDDNDLSKEEQSAVWDKITQYPVWGNEYFLPFGYTYPSYISAEDYADMSLLEKQEAMLQGIVINEANAKGEKTELKFTGKSMDFELSEEDGINIEKDTIIVTKSNSSLNLTFEGMENAETYLYITGLSYTGIAPVDQYSALEWDLLSTYEQNEVRYSQRYYEDTTSPVISISSINTEGTSTSNILTYYTSEYTWYSGREDFVINLGYDEFGKVSITLVFPTPGKYQFDSIEVLCQPMVQYAAQITSLGENVLKNVDFHNDNAAFATNMVSGTVSLDSDKYLLLSIPYGEGWTAYVDGEEQDVLQANTMYMALYLEEGDHEIQLKYRTPGLCAGSVVSAISVIMLGLSIIYRRRRRHAIVNHRTSDE